MLFCFSFYKRDRDVQGDTELQAFVNELSAQGTGPDGGRGQVKKVAFAVDSVQMHMYAGGRPTKVALVGDS